jgi:hypothetical protein
MAHSPSTIIYEPAGAGDAFFAAVFSPDGQVLASRSFPTRAAAEAFLQAFMQENAGEYGLVHDQPSSPSRERPESKRVSGGLRERRAGVIQSAIDETKRRRLGVFGRKLD